jgi:hypothetical protein
MPRPAPLPSDVQSLQRLVREQQAQLLSRDVLIEQLKLQLAVAVGRAHPLMQRMGP